MLQRARRHTLQAKTFETALNRSAWYNPVNIFCSQRLRWQSVTFAGDGACLLPVGHEPQATA